MSNVDAPNVNADGETTNQELLVEQSGVPAMTKKFTIETDTEILGDLDVTGTVTATSFIGDGSQLTGISGGGGPQSEIISGDAFVRIEEGDPDGDSAAPVNLKMVSIGGTDLWDVDVSSLNDINISSGDDITISAGDWMELQTQNEFYITSGDKIDLETDEYIELNGDVYLRDGHPLRLQDDFAGVNPGMESFVQDLGSATSTEVPSAIAVKSVTDDLQSQINNLSGGGGLDSAGVISLTGAQIETSAGGLDYTSLDKLRVEGGAVGLSTIDADTFAESLSYSGTYQLAGNPSGASSQRITHHLWSSGTLNNANLTAPNDVYVGSRYAGTKFSYPAMKSYVPTAAQFGGGFEWDQAGTTVLDLSTEGAVFGSGVTMTDLTSSGVVIFSALPTTDPVNAGQLWNDAGTLKVSAG